MERLKDGGVRLALVGAIGIVSLLAPASAGAGFPGGNAQIVFVSGRDDGATTFSSSTAQVWLLDDVNDTTPTRITTTNNTVRHQHPTWSPDRTRIAYALGPPGDRDIVIQTLSNGNITALRTTPGVDDDRPAWSPDGTRIAYTRAGQIVTDTVPAGITTTPISVAGGDVEDRPAWSPDSKTLYYSGSTAGNLNIVRELSDGSQGAATDVITQDDMGNAASNDFQPNVSPDGSKICFTRGGFDDTADLWTADALALNSNQVEVGKDNSLAEFNCTWSPDGTKLLYALGQFTTASVVVKNSDGTGSPTPIGSNVAGRFDGNPDWASDPFPSCQNGSVNVALNGFVSVPLSCTDPEGQSVSRNIVTPPGHGNIGQIQNDNTVIYTPAKDFKGTDTFTFNGNDGKSDSSPATITVNVGTTGKDVTPAKIDKVVVSHKVWRRGSGLPLVLSRRAPVGTTISYRLSEKARVTFTFARRSRGRKVGRRCVKPKRSNRRKRRCTRYVKAGTLHFDGKQGTNRVKFQGRLSRRKRLAVGRYRLVVGAKDAAGNVSKNAKPVFFKIVKR
jgi:Big-like domain-containing protein/WD40 repeat protein